MKIRDWSVLSITTNGSKLPAEMAESDFSSLSDSEEDGGPPVSLNCGSCKKIFKSSDRGCDTDERTCSTCTKKVHKALKNAFMVDTEQEKPSETAAPSTLNILPDQTENRADVAEDDAESAEKRQGDEAGDVANTADGHGIELRDENSLLNKEYASDRELARSVDESESDGYKTPKVKSKNKKGRRQASDYDPELDDLLVDEESIEVLCGGETRTFVRKRFRMDSGNTIRYFSDLELLDRIPLLYSYIVLSAHINPILKRGVRSLRVVVNHQGKKMVVLCVFRSKCPQPRFDVVVLDPAENDPAKAVTRMCGLTNFFKWFKYVPDEKFDIEYAIGKLLGFVTTKFDDKGRALVYDKTKGPNKDEMGRPMTDGYDPINPINIEKDGMTPLSSKRNAGKPSISYAEEFGDAVRNKRGQKSTTKKKAPAKIKVSTSLFKQEHT